MPDSPSNETIGFSRLSEAELRHELASAALTIVDLREQLDASRIDVLTGILDRRAFTELYTELFERSKYEVGKLGLAIVDLNYLKEINDTYGHAVGDKYLRLVAEALKDNTRPLDSVYRIGGDEFGLIMPGLNGTEEERQITKDRIRNDINKTVQTNLAPGIPIGIAIGVDVMRVGDTPDVLLSRVDAYMYEDKIKSKQLDFNT